MRLRVSSCFELALRGRQELVLTRLDGVGGYARVVFDAAGHYQGEALFTLGGTVRLATSALEGGESGELRVALFWAREDSLGSGALSTSLGAVEQQVDATTSFPARFTLSIRRPPEDALIGTAPDVSGAYAVAMVLVYLDQDGDVRWDRESEPLVGAAPGVFLLYTPDGLGGGRFGAMAAGFHLLDAASGACAATTSVAADASAVVIQVYGGYPEQALLDLDCDGLSEEWSGTCPDLATVAAACRDVDGDGIVGVCETCEHLLWDDDAGESECDEWREACEGITDQEECQRAADHCHDGHHADEPPR